MENGDDAPWNEDDYDFDRRRLTVQKKKEQTDDPDYEQPQMHMHTAPHARPEPHGAPVSGTGPQSASSKPDVCCLVKGCHADLSNSKAYYRRFRICEAHMKSLSLSIEGRSCRFCQQCGKFHLVEEFDGANRNCRKALMIRFYKRRNMPLTNLQAASSGRADAQAAAAAATPAPVHQELKLEPRKRGRPRAPRPDILEDDPAATSGGSGPGSPPPGGSGGGSGAARAAAAAGFDSALQAAYIAASRGYQGATGLGVTPATAIGPPGYSQGGVRMAGIEIDEIDDEYDRPPARRRGGGGAAAAQGRRAGGADRAGGSGGDVMSLEDMQSHLQAHVQAQLEASQAQSGHGGGGPSDRGPQAGYLPEGRHGSGSLSRCSSSHSQDHDGGRPSRGGGGRGALAATLQLGGGGAAAAAGGGGGGAAGGSDGTREAADALAALGGALAPLLDAGTLGMLSGGSPAAAQLDLASLLNSLGAGGLMQVLPAQAGGGEGPRLQFVRPQPPGAGAVGAGQLLEESGGWRVAAADAEAAQPANSRPSHASARSSDGAAAAAAPAGGGRRGAPKLGGFPGGVMSSPSPPQRHGLHLPDYQEGAPPGQDGQQLQQQQLLRGAAGSGCDGGLQQLQQQQRGGAAAYGNPGAAGRPPSMAVIKREGVEVLPGPGPGVVGAVVAVTQDHEDVDRWRHLPLRDATAIGAGGVGGGLGVAATPAEAFRHLDGPRWGASAIGVDVSAGVVLSDGRGGGAAGRSYDRDRDRDVLGLDVGGGARAGPGLVQQPLLLGAHGGLAATVDARHGGHGGGAAQGGGGAFIAARGGGGLPYLLEPGGALAVEPPPPRPEVRSLAAAGAAPPPLAPGSAAAATDEEKRNAAVARLLSQLPVSQQLDFLQQMPHDQMVALLQMLPHTQQVELLLELQDERRMQVMQQQQQRQQQQQQQQHQQQQQQQQQQPLVVLQGRSGGVASGAAGAGAGAGRTTLALDLALDPLSSAGQAAAQRITLAPQPLPRKPARPPAVAAAASLSFQQQQQHHQQELMLAQQHHQHHRHGDAAEAVGPLELVSLAGAGTRLQRMPDGRTQVVLELPVAAAPPPQQVPVLRLQPSGGQGAGGGGGGTTVQLATEAGSGGGGGASISLPGNGSLLLNLGDGSIRLPGNALVVRQSGLGGHQGGKAAPAGRERAVCAPLLAVDYGAGERGGGGAGGGEDALERLSLKLHGMRPEQLAPGVAQRMHAWLQSMDAVTLQGTLRSGCVNLVLDVNLRSPPPAVHPAAAAAASGSRRRGGGGGGALVQTVAPPPAQASPSLDDVIADGSAHVCGGGGGSRTVPRELADCLAAAALAAALGLDVCPDDGGGATAAAVGAAAAAMGVRAMVQVGCQVVYPPDAQGPADSAVPVLCELAPLALVRGEPVTLHMACDSLAEPSARLHVRLNGRRLGAFVQPEAELQEPPSPPPLAQQHCHQPQHCQQQQQQQQSKPVPLATTRDTSGSTELQQQRFASSAATGCGDAAEALVFLDPPPEAGLAVVEWEGGGGGAGVLGSWWPLVVAPSAEVAAEVNGLAVAAPPLLRRLTSPSPQQIDATGDGNASRLTEGGNEEEGLAVSAAVEEEERKGIGGVGVEACRFHQLLTDLGLVLDALHNSTTTTITTTAKMGGADDSDGADSCCGSPSSCSSSSSLSAFDTLRADDSDSDGGSGSGARVPPVPRPAAQRERGDASACCCSDDARAVPVLMLPPRRPAPAGPVAPAGSLTASWSASAGAAQADRDMRDVHLARAVPSAPAAAQAPALIEHEHMGPEPELDRCSAAAATRPTPARLSPLCALSERALSAAATAGASASGDPDLDARVLDCYVRRAKRLLPFCLARAMPHTAAEVLRFLMHVARVPFSELAGLRVHEQRQTPRRQAELGSPAAASLKAAGPDGGCDGGGGGSGFSLLHVAAFSGCPACVALLLREGARSGVACDPQEAGPGGWTPLQLAALRSVDGGAAAAVTLLLRYDAAVASAAPSWSSIVMPPRHTAGPSPQQSERMHGSLSDKSICGLEMADAEARAGHTLAASGRSTASGCWESSYCVKGYDGGDDDVVQHVGPGLDLIS